MPSFERNLGLNTAPLAQRETPLTNLTTIMASLGDECMSLMLNFKIYFTLSFFRNFFKDYRSFPLKFNKSSFLLQETLFLASGHPRGGGDLLPAPRPSLHLPAAVRHLRVS